MMEITHSLRLIASICLLQIVLGCNIPTVLRGSWFSWENGKNTVTEINAETMTSKGVCVDMKEDFHVNYTIVFQHAEDNCYHCVKFLVRTVNVLEKMDSGCVSLRPGVTPTVDNVCKKLASDQSLVTLFSENYVPVNCRSSLEGVWQFAYQVNLNACLFLYLILLWGSQFS
uniref:DUF7044 domain-containing protein n=1 Tax=Cacopsylla melanoneura TaxID=428564 RepID=A0A8D9EFD8_9HEMI